MIGINNKRIKMFQVSCVAIKRVKIDEEFQNDEFEDEEPMITKKATRKVNKNWFLKRR
jgi:hypothetical protein